jgi:hypothetical protein
LTAILAIGIFMRKSFDAFSKLCYNLRRLTLEVGNIDKLTHFMKRIAIVGLSFVWLFTASSFAKDSSYKDTLSHVPAAELPVRAAELIKNANARSRETVTIGVVKAAVSINPAAAPVIVASIARAVPDMASIAAATAAAAQPKQAVAITKAAAAAAPSKAALIVVAVCRAVPADYKNIAVAAAQAVPGSDKEILTAMAAAFPELKSGIDSLLTSHSGNPPNVSYALTSISPATSQSGPGTTTPSIPAPLARGPAIGPPFIPLSQTPTNVTPGTSGNVPPGTRGGPTDYAQP